MAPLCLDQYFPLALTARRRCADSLLAAAEPLCPVCRQRLLFCQDVFMP